MGVNNSYFRTVETDFSDGVQMELRARFAWELIRTYGLIAATEDGEDGARRSKLRLQSPEEAVARCFAFAETFVATCEERNYLKSITVTREDMELADEERSNQRNQRMFEMMMARKVQELEAEKAAGKPE